MPTETIPISIDLDVPLPLVQQLLRQHLLASLGTPGNGHTNGQAPTTVPVEKEEAAPVLPASTGAP